MKFNKVIKESKKKYYKLDERELVVQDKISLVDQKLKELTPPEDNKEIEDLKTRIRPYRIFGKRKIKLIKTGPDAGDKPVDTHGKPEGFLAYGRGGWINGKLWMEGGYQGSRSGHPDGIKDGFYWGVSSDGTLYIRGRAGMNDALLDKYQTQIFGWIANQGL